MHHDDSKSLDVVALIEVDEVSASVGVHHRDAGKPFFVNRDQEYQTLAHLSRCNDVVGQVEMADNFVVQYFHFL